MVSTTGDCLRHSIYIYSRWLQHPITSVRIPSSYHNNIPFMVSKMHITHNDVDIILAYKQVVMVALSLVPKRVCMWHPCVQSLAPPPLLPPSLLLLLILMLLLSPRLHQLHGCLLHRFTRHKFLLAATALICGGVGWGGLSQAGHVPVTWAHRRMLTVSPPPEFPLSHWLPCLPPLYAGTVRERQGLLLTLPSPPLPFPSPSSSPPHPPSLCGRCPGLCWPAPLPGPPASPPLCSAAPAPAPRCPGQGGA